MLFRAGQNRNDARRPLIIIGKAVISECGGGNVPQFGARIALQNHKAPRRKLAVIGHARGNAQQLAQLRIIGPRRGHIPGQNRSTLFQKLCGLDHAVLFSYGALPAIWLRPMIVK